MKPLYKDWVFWLLFVLAAIVLAYSVHNLDANAQVINAKGSAGACVAVSQSPVVVLDAKLRKTWTLNWLETNDVRCEPIQLGATSPALAPTGTIGFPMQASKTPWKADNVTDNASLGWSCYAIAGTDNVCSYEGF